MEQFLLFYFGIKKDCPELITAVEQIEFTDEDAKVSQMFSNGNLLLAAYLTPYVVIEKSLLKAFNESAKLFNDVVNKRVSSPLSVLSRLHLLSVFTHSMTSTYGYDFFVEALESRSIEISCVTNPSDDQYTELFFINSVLISINKSKGFELMVKNYGKNIPMIFQVGMNHTTENKAVTPLVKKYIKKHMKSVHKNKSLHESIIDLYDEPINKIAALKLEKELLSVKIRNH